MAKSSSVWFKLMLLLVPIMWGAGFVFMKSAVDVLPPAYLLGVRFTITGLIMCLLFLPTILRTFSNGKLKGFDKATIKDYFKISFWMAFWLFTSYWIQTVGLIYTTPGKNAFITGTYCVMVPFLWWALVKRKPTVYNIVAAVLCSAGLGFVALTEGVTNINIGDFYTLICAFLNAVLIVYVARSTGGHNIITLTAFEFLFAGLMGFLLAVFTETWPAGFVLDKQFFSEMGYLVIFCSIAANTLMNIGLNHVEPAPASLIMSLEAVFGVLFSVLLYHEVISLQIAIGFILIFLAIIMSEALPYYIENAKVKRKAKLAAKKIEALDADETKAKEAPTNADEAKAKEAPTNAAVVAVTEPSSVESAAAD